MSLIVDIHLHPGQSPQLQGTDPCTSPLNSDPHLYILNI